MLQSDLHWRRACLPNHWRVRSCKLHVPAWESAPLSRFDLQAQMLRQGDAQVMKKYSQMKLQMKRDALEKLNRLAGELAPVIGERNVQGHGPMSTVIE